MVLGIESSCDETGAGLVRLTADGVELLGQSLASSQDQHARFGGVVPEIAVAGPPGGNDLDGAAVRSTPPGSGTPMSTRSR